MMPAKPLPVAPCCWRATADHPGLAGMQSQPERSQSGRCPFPGRFGPGLGRAEHDEVVGILAQLPQPRRAARPLLIKQVQGDIAEQRG